MNRSTRSSASSVRKPQGGRRISPPTKPSPASSPSQRPPIHHPRRRRRPSPKPEDTVTVNYRGTLIDGTEFDRSPTNQPPPSPPMASPRLDRGAHAHEGRSKWKLFIPSDLAYGLMAAAEIGPNATLLLDVELVPSRPPSRRRIPIRRSPATSSKCHRSKK